VNKTNVLRQAGVFFLLIVILAGCNSGDKATVENEVARQVDARQAPDPVRPEIYADFKLVSDLRGLSDNQRKMLVLLIEASEIMDDLYWQQAFGENHAEWLQSIDDEGARHFADMNYGPWDRLDDEKPFIAGVGEKPLGAQFYPLDMSQDELDEAQGDGKDGLYTLRRRDSSGSVVLVGYHEAYSEQLGKAAALLREAADLAAHPGFANYLRLRADAFMSNEYMASDMAWMDVKTNPIELVIGPIETYEDRLFGFRSAFEAYVLIKDIEWSERLAKFSAFLPELQRGLPVPDEYKAENPGSDSDLNAYEVIYYAGHSNAGSKTIAINLPNDEEVQLAKGTRRLQLKNAMQAKFEKILEPIAGVLIDESQRHHITFDAFFANTMFHEVAHGLGVKNTINRKGLVRTSLRDIASSIEEGKADILGLLHDRQVARGW
jgi:hypothetical protein